MALASQSPPLIGKRRQPDNSNSNPFISVEDNNNNMTTARDGSESDENTTDSTDINASIYNYSSSQHSSCHYRRRGYSSSRIAQKHASLIACDDLNDDDGNDTASSADLSSISDDGESIADNPSSRPESPIAFCTNDDDMLNDYSDPFPSDLSSISDSSGDRRHDDRRFENVLTTVCIQSNQRPKGHQQRMKKFQNSLRVESLHKDHNNNESRETLRNVTSCDNIRPDCTTIEDNFQQHKIHSNTERATSKNAHKSQHMTGIDKLQSYLQDKRKADLLPRKTPTLTTVNTSGSFSGNSSGKSSGYSETIITKEDTDFAKESILNTKKLINKNESHHPVMRGQNKPFSQHYCSNVRLNSKNESEMKKQSSGMINVETKSDVAAANLPGVFKARKGSFREALNRCNNDRLKVEQKDQHSSDRIIDIVAAAATEVASNIPKNEPTDNETSYPNIHKDFRHSVSLRTENIS